MKFKLYFYILYFIVLLNESNSEENSNDNSFGTFSSKESKDGENQYNLMKHEAKIPQYGECYAKALKDLHDGCARLTDEIQSRLALTFTNCYIFRFGWDIYPCTPKQDLKECMKNLDSRATSVYSSMLTNTLSMCHFIQAQIWNMETQNAVHKLRDVSDAVTHKLVDAVESASNLKNQLQDQLVQSRSDLKYAFDEIKESANEQRGLIVDIFDKLSRLHSLLMDEFNWFYSVVFYVACTIVTFLVTSTSRTSGARLGVLLILAISLVLERMLVPNLFHYLPIIMTQEKYHWCIWCVRRITITFSFLNIIYTVLQYSDPALENAHRLEELNKATVEIKRLINSNPAFELSAVALKAIDTCYNESDSDDGNYNPEEDEALEQDISTESGILDMFTEVFSPKRKTSPYTLRDRSKLKTSTNPVVHIESPDLFHKKIRMSADRTQMKNKFRQTNNYELSALETPGKSLLDECEEQCTPIKCPGDRVNDGLQITQHREPQTPIKSPRVHFSPSTSIIHVTPLKRFNSECSSPNKKDITPMKIFTRSGSQYISKTSKEPSTLLCNTNCYSPLQPPLPSSNPIGDTIREVQTPTKNGLSDNTPMKVM